MSKKTNHSSITKVNWLILFWKIINVHCETHVKHKNTTFAENAELLNAKEGGTDSNHSCLTFISYWCGYLNFNALLMKNMSTT
jgi:hypothetical protein